MEKDPSIKQIEMNKEVGQHGWTPLYRAGWNRNHGYSKELLFCV